jgi:hypothetical protein
VSHRYLEILRWRALIRAGGIGRFEPIFGEAGKFNDAVEASFRSISCHHLLSPVCFKILLHLVADAGRVVCLLGNFIRQDGRDPSRTGVAQNRSSTTVKQVCPEIGKNSITDISLALWVGKMA